MRLIFAYTLSILLFFTTACAYNDDYILAQHYIERHKQLAIDEMFKMGVPASIKLAQGMLETDFGKSRLANEGKNHFGIKCKTYWEGDTILIDDDAPQECFRRYNSVEESYIDHSFFLRYHPKHNYDGLFSLNKRDYLSWAWGLQDAGYATNPNYADGLINLIEKYELFRFDDYEQFYPKGSKRPAMVLPDENGYYAAYSKSPEIGKWPAENTKNQEKKTINSIYYQNQQPTNLQSSPNYSSKTDKKQTNPPILPQLPKTAPELPKESNPNYADATPIQGKYYISNGKFIARAATPAIAETDNTASYEHQPLNIKELYVNGSLALLANRQLSPIYISHYYDISLKKLYAYNDMQPGDVFKPNSPVFLAPKSKKAAQGQDVYLARKNETLYDIAQRFGMRLKSLQKHNQRYTAMLFKGGERVKLK